MKQKVWSNYSDLTRPHPKWWFSKGNPLISGKSRLVKYYNLTRKGRLKQRRFTPFVDSTIAFLTGETLGKEGYPTCYVRYTLLEYNNCVGSYELLIFLRYPCILVGVGSSETIQKDCYLSFLWANQIHDFCPLIWE